MSRKGADIPVWVYQGLIGILFSGVLFFAWITWDSLQERVSRTNDRQTDMDRRLTRIETKLDLAP